MQLEGGQVPKNYYDELVSDEEEVIRKLDMSKNMTDDEIRATAKRNVYNGTDVGSQHKYDKEVLKEKASLNEETLKEYNAIKRKEHENEIHLDGYEEYKDLTMEDVKQAREDLKTYDSKENLQKKYSEKEAERKDRKDNTKLNGVYRTYKDGKVVGETVIKNGKVVSNVDNTRQYGNNNAGFEFKSHENIGQRDLLRDTSETPIVKPTEPIKAPTETPKVTQTETPKVTPPKSDEKTTQEKFEEHKDKIKNGEIPWVVRSGTTERVRVRNGTMIKRDYDKRVADEMEIIRKLPMSKNMTDDEIEATARRNVFNRKDTTKDLISEKAKLTEIANLDENSLKAYNDTQRKNAYNEFNNTRMEYKDVTMEDVKKAKEDLKTIDSEEHIQEVYSANEKERKRIEDEAERKEAKRNNVNKLNPPPVSQTSEVSVVNTADKVNAPTETPKVTATETPKVTPTVTPKKAEEKTIQEKFDDHQAKIKSGEIPKIVHRGNQTRVILKDGNYIQKKTYDRRVANEMDVIRKLPMSKNMTDEEIEATARRNVYSKTDVTLSLNNERNKLTEIANLDENSLKAYNDKQRKNAVNTFNDTRMEYKDITLEDVEKAKEDLKAIDSQEHLQEVYSEKENERKKQLEEEKATEEANRNNVNKLNPPPVSQTSEVSVVNTADKVNASSNATTINKPSDIGVPPRDDGLVMQNNAEQIKQQEKDASKEMKVEVVNNNVQNINQTNDRRDPMYSRNVDPSYVRTVDERHGIMG